MKSQWQDKPVTILGLSKSGMSVARYLARHGAHCFLSETVPASPANKENREALQAMGVAVEMGGHTAKCFEHSDLVVVSPGIPPTSQILKELSVSGKTIISEVELAYRESETPWIGITGTNGKTTTTTLISKILQTWGKHAPACGNIGSPVIDWVDEAPDFLVAELSSFQLTFSPTLKAKVALLLNFRPDHLDWHGSVESYKQAKFNLFTGGHQPEWAVLNADDPVCRELGQQLTGNVLWFSRNPDSLVPFTTVMTVRSDGKMVLRRACQPDTEILNTADLKLVGAHNVENVLAAAAAAWLVGTPADVIATGATLFEGVEHRLEPVLTHDGIAYYNDSKATNPDATLSALVAFAPRKVVLIAGGRDKMTDLSEFVASVKANTTHVVLIGEAADRFALELQAGGYANVHHAASLEDAVAQASKLAVPETPVLFSPACASFDMFKNFEVRGQAFKDTVRQRLAAPTP